MDKGIRPEARAKFAALNEERRRGLVSNKDFRKAVMDHLIEQFGITLASAATHYNEAFKFLKELNAELVDGLGRAEDKKGGRKPKQKEEAAAVEEFVGPILPELVNVLKAKDNSMVAERVTREVAQALVDKAASQKKAKLVIQ
jgi:hypothetical protein